MGNYIRFDTECMDKANRSLLNISNMLLSNSESIFSVIKSLSPQIKEYRVFSQESSILIDKMASFSKQVEKLYLMLDDIVCIYEQAERDIVFLHERLITQISHNQSSENIKLDKIPIAHSMLMSFQELVVEDWLLAAAFQLSSTE